VAVFTRTFMRTKMRGMKEEKEKFFPNIAEKKKIAFYYFFVPGTCNLLCHVFKLQCSRERLTNMTFCRKRTEINRKETIASDKTISNVTNDCIFLVH